jgi:hypothetical protein
MLLVAARGASLPSPPVAHRPPSGRSPVVQPVIESRPPPAEVPAEPAPTLSRNQPPSARREGLSWSLEQVQDYLSAKGVTFNTATRMQAAVPGVWMTSPGSPGDALMLEQFPDASAAAAAGVARRKEKQFVYQWGRFVFSGKDGRLLRSIRNVLE